MASAQETVVASSPEFKPTNFTEFQTKFTEDVLTMSAAELKKRLAIGDRLVNALADLTQLNVFKDWLVSKMAIVSTEQLRIEGLLATDYLANKTLLPKVASLGEIAGRLTDSLDAVAVKIKSIEASKPATFKDLAELLFDMKDETNKDVYVEKVEIMLKRVLGSMNETPAVVTSNQVKKPLGLFGKIEEFRKGGSEDPAKRWDRAFVDREWRKELSNVFSTHLDTRPSRLIDFLRAANDGKIDSTKEMNSLAIFAKVLELLGGYETIEDPKLKPNLSAAEILDKAQKFIQEIESKNKKVYLQFWVRLHRELIEKSKFVKVAGTSSQNSVGGNPNVVANVNAQPNPVNPVQPETGPKPEEQQKSLKALYIAQKTELDKHPDLTAKKTFIGKQADESATASIMIMEAVKDFSAVVNKTSPEFDEKKASNKNNMLILLLAVGDKAYYDTLIETIKKTNSYDSLKELVEKIDKL